jgi:hypothetical protein
MCPECDRPRRRLKRWRRRVGKLLKSPTLLRIAFASAPYIFRLVRWIERNIGNDG